MYPSRDTTIFFNANCSFYGRVADSFTATVIVLLSIYAVAFVSMAE
ncbi:hypothetical protein ANCCAN_23682 [Ancylostoma caninum]|uniref:Uncharacterized protein n=1 Tax=Ancylostoma caninum TaxID=29170 RepID=A0A368FED7_ANCCA|nr:hypothetical protein ANCCAN_23682 [Ancylostoma caninum]